MRNFLLSASFSYPAQKFRASLSDVHEDGNEDESHHHHHDGDANACVHLKILHDHDRDYVELFENVHWLPLST